MRAAAKHGPDSIPTHVAGAWRNVTGRFLNLYKKRTVIIPLNFVSTGRRQNGRQCHIHPPKSDQRTGVYAITASSSVASSLKMTGRRPSLQLQTATPGLRIQSP